MPKFDRRLVLAIAGLAIAVRIAAVLVLQSHTVPRSTYEHGPIAANLLAGCGFSVEFLGAEGPTSQQAPVYPFVVAAAYALGGVETPQALLILFVAQAALGGLMVFGTMRLARRLLPERPGTCIAAGLIAALHPTLVFAVTHVQVAGLAATLFVWLFATAEAAGRRRDRRSALAHGLVLGLLVLTDPILALAEPPALLVLMGAAGRFRLAWRPAIAGLACGGLIVAPWIVRNARVHGEFVFVKSTFGYAFWQGNCRLSAGTDKVERATVDAVLDAERARNGDSPAGWNAALWAARHEAGYLDDIALTRADRAALGRLSEPERSRVLFRRALSDLRADPGRYPALCLKRLRMFLFFDETNPKTRHPLYRVGHLGLTLLAAAGWLAMTGTERRRPIPTLLAFLLIATFHALTIVSARFHIPLEPLMAVWAGASIDAIARLRSAVASVLLTRPSANHPRVPTVS